MPSVPNKGNSSQQQQQGHLGRAVLRPFGALATPAQLQASSDPASPPPLLSGFQSPRAGGRITPAGSVIRRRLQHLIRRGQSPSSLNAGSYVDGLLLVLSLLRAAVHGKMHAGSIQRAAVFDVTPPASCSTPPLPPLAGFPTLSNVLAKVPSFPPRTTYHWFFTDRIGRFNIDLSQDRLS